MCSEVFDAVVFVVIALIFAALLAQLPWCIFTKIKIKNFEKKKSLCTL